MHPSIAPVNLVLAFAYPLSSVAYNTPYEAQYCRTLLNFEPFHREDAEFKTLGAQEQVSAPATVSGFKTHPLYVLQRHITKFQALQPGTTPAGAHKCVDPRIPTSLDPRPSI